MTRRDNDREMLLDCSSWPCWPYLPVKRLGKTSGEWPEVCVIHVGPAEDGVWSVWRVNMFDLPDTYEEFEQLQKYEYDSVDDLLADGWVVD